MSKRLHYLFLGIALVVLLGLVVLKTSGDAAAILATWEGDGGHLLLLLVVAAVVDSINPCAFSVLLITIAFLLSLGKTRRSVFTTGLSIFLVYVLIGLGLLQALTLFGVPRIMSYVGAFIIIVFGALDVLNHYYPNFPLKLKLPKSSHGPIARLMEKGSAPAAFLLGGVVGLFEFPCTGGPYLFILGMLHDSATAAQGFGYLVLYNLVFVAPLIILLAIASDPVLLEKAQAWRKSSTGAMRVGGGIAMMLLGLLLLAL
jgi:cytochrome c biogenesis protein CcdA